MRVSDQKRVCVFFFFVDGRSSLAESCPVCSCPMYKYILLKFVKLVLADWCRLPGCLRGRSHVLGRYFFFRFHQFFVVMFSLGIAHTGTSYEHFFPHPEKGNIVLYYNVRYLVDNYCSTMGFFIGMDFSKKVSCWAGYISAGILLCIADSSCTIWFQRRVRLRRASPPTNNPMGLVARTRI